MQVGSNARTRRIYIVLTVALALLGLASLCVPVTSATVSTPAQVVDAFATWGRLTAELLTQNVHYNATEIMAMCPQYYQVLTRFGLTLAAILCGAMLALSGSLYQMVFRNPIAAPTMLGVGNGVTLGVIVLVLIFGGNAIVMVGPRYLLCYVGALLVLGIVVGLSLALGRGKLVPVDMLLIGSVVSALLGQTIVFFSYSVFDADTWAVFNSINEVIDIDTQLFCYAVLVIMFLVSTAPVLLMRFKMNMVAFDPQEMRLAGIDATKLRVIALVCGTLMIITVQVQIGTVAMVALVAPFASRKLFGAEFRKQFWGDVLLGALFIVACLDAAALVNAALTVNDVLISLPLGTITNVVLLPVFAWVLGTQRRGWE